MENEESIKKSWLSYFLSIRDSRRNDMRHYTSLCVASVVSILLFLSIITLNESLFSLRGFLIFIAFFIILICFFKYYFNQYKISEDEIKDYSDAIELVIINEPKNNSEYQKLYYLLTTRKYERQTDWGKYLSMQNYWKSAFIKRQRQNDDFFQKHHQEVPLLYECYMEYKKVMNSLNLKKYG